MDAQGDLFGASGPNAAETREGPKPDPKVRALAPDDAAAAACDFLETLQVPTGSLAGHALSLAPYQRQFIEGALAPGVTAAVLSIGRGNGKSALCSGLALGALLGAWDPQPRREVILAARTRDQARIAFDYTVAFIESLPYELRLQLQIRKAPRLEVEYHGAGGHHILRAIPADAKTSLGSSPTLVIMDERGMWDAKGDELEAALLSGLVKRDGRALIISTSAPDDAHPFSRWLDEPPEGAYVQEHRPEPGLPADDRESLLIANPGAEAGLLSIERLEREARQAIKRGGAALDKFRLWNRNERVSGEAREMLLFMDQWLACETDQLPQRHGEVVVGLDIGSSASMTAAAYYWPATGRLEAHATFPTRPALLDRGQTDGVGDRYVQMEHRGELDTLGELTVPIRPWIEAALQRVGGSPIAAVVTDRFRKAEVAEAMLAGSMAAPLILRGQGTIDGNEDVERFRRAVFEGHVRAAESLLLRSAMSDAVCKRDENSNVKLVKGRSTGRIDAVSAAVLAVAHGARLMGQPQAEQELLTL